MKSLALIVASLPFITTSPASTASQAGEACRFLPTDAKFPSEAEWKTLPGVIARGVQTKKLHPDYRMDVKSVEEVQAAAKFAKKNNVRLSVIHSGHDGLGRNDAPSGLLLSLEKLGGVRVEQTWTPSAQGSPKVASGKKTGGAAPPKDGGMAGMAGMAGMKRHGPEGDGPKASVPPASAQAPAPAAGNAYAVTFGAGITTQQMNDKIASQGIFTNGAEHGEVGVAGGWSQCGGHGPMTSAYGLGSDNVLEFQVVTADGELKIANAVANPDLYWALRGGCGSTFGIVTQATIRAYPSPKMTVTKFTLNATDGGDYYEPLAYLHSVMPELSEKGVQGYYLVFAKQFVGIFHTVGSLANPEASAKIWDPVMTKLATYPGLVKESVKATYLNYDSYKTYYDATWGPLEGEPAFKKRSAWDNEEIIDWWTGEKVKRADRHLRKRHGPGEAAALPVSMGKTVGDGRLLSKENLKDARLGPALKSAMPSNPGGMLRGALVGGGNVIKKSPTETSVHPSWRKTYVSLWSDKDVDEVAKMSPGMGAYINEASYNETNWQENFWGSNYPKLSQIKTKYDPDMVFYVTPGINADKMAANGKGALCVASGTQSKSVFPPAGDNKNCNKGVC